MSLHTFRVVAIFLASLAICGCVSTGQPISNIEDKVIPTKLDGSDRSLDDVREAIAKGCMSKGWTPVVVDESQIKCSILVRGKHYAEVNIPFTESGYSIVYADSRVLDYDPEQGRIHRNYNKWVILLSQSIDQQMLN